MPDIWRVYRAHRCRYTKSRTNKFVVIVCKDEYYMGFLVNTRINPYILKRPSLLECQVALSKKDYNFLFYDSYLNCAKLLPFTENELSVGLQVIDNETKAEIQRVVSKAKTIEPRYRKLILDG